MILTLKKIQHKGADRIGICFPYYSLHNLLHSIATHLIETCTDVKHIQKLLGHSSFKTTMVYTLVTNKAINRIQSPLDRLNLTTEDKNEKKNDKKV
jgi:site-specific recombinase XerD